MEERESLDVAVIGAGPAGLTAGLYAARAGLKVSMFEQLSPGGQLATTEHLENYPGFSEGSGGFDLAWAMKEQAERFGATLVSEEVVSVDFTGDEKVIATPARDYRAKTVIVATGARPRKLGVEGEQDLAGAGVSYCATCDGNFFRGRTVVVVGGGNTAVADVIYLSRICERVYLVHRRDSLRATPVYEERLRALENVELVWSSRVVELLSTEASLSGIVVESVIDGSRREIACQGLFVAVGMQPNTEFLGDALAKTPGGYLDAKEDCLTSVPGVFAAGDVRVKDLRQVVTAVSDGAIAAEKAAEFLSV